MEQQMHACLSWSSNATSFLMNVLPSCMQTNVSEDNLVTFYSSSFTDHLQGVDIIGEIHFVLTKGEKSSFKWEEYGYKLQVPKGTTFQKG